MTRLRVSTITCALMASIGFGQAGCGRTPSWQVFVENTTPLDAHCVIVPPAAVSDYGTLTHYSFVNFSVRPGQRELVESSSAIESGPPVKNPNMLIGIRLPDDAWSTAPMFSVPRELSLRTKQISIIKTNGTINLLSLIHI